MKISIVQSPNLILYLLKFNTLFLDDLIGNIENFFSISYDVKDSIKL